jgi:hypothetical protein
MKVLSPANKEIHSHQKRYVSAILNIAELLEEVQVVLHIVYSTGSAANLALDAHIDGILIRPDSAQPSPIWHAPVDATTCHVAVADSEFCMQQPKP